MRTTIKKIFPAIALMLLLTGCQAITGETLGENIDDTTITTTVKAKLAAEKGTTLTRIQVVPIALSCNYPVSSSRPRIALGPNRSPAASAVSRASSIIYRYRAGSD